MDNKKYVALSNVESYNLWIEFIKSNTQLGISLVIADKPNGSMDIEYQLTNKSNSRIHYSCRNEGRIVKKAAYVALGVKLDGTKEFLSNRQKFLENKRTFCGLTRTQFHKNKKIRNPL